MNAPETVLFSCRQHGYVLAAKTARWLPLAAGAYAAAWAVSGKSHLWGAIAGFAVLSDLFLLEFWLWSQSALVVTSESLCARVRNGIFSRFETRIRFDHIRDCAYSKNNLLHFATGAGTLFARSSAGAEGDFQAQNVPNVAKVFSLVSDLMKSSPAERAAGKPAPAHSPSRSREEAVRENLAILRSIPGVTAAAEIDADDRRFAFGNEEDRNHGVYETLRRQVVLCLLHDSSFRGADGSIVLTLGSKVTFPPVSFHEVREKNAVSSSPCLEVHQRLLRHFPGAAADDATVLVGFDL